MKKSSLLYLFFICFVIFTNKSYSQIIFETPLSNRIVEYNIDAKLSPEKKIIKAKMNMSWLNTSTDTLSELQFHTYMNAFKNTASTFMIESGGQLRGHFLDAENDNSWGWIDIEIIKTKGGNELNGSYKFIQPDDKNIKDETVFSLRLPRAVAPGDKVELEFEFTVKLPKIFARAGFSNNFFFVGQWFPKIGVYEKGENGKYSWNCHQYHANSEFYADFGVYNVSISVPENYLVAGSGVLQEVFENKNGTKTHKFRGEDIIDFAWSASPNFQVKEYNWKGVDVKIFLQPEHFKLADRHTFAVNTALEYFEKTLGKYPYKNLSVVDPPMEAIGAGGMEYPSLITTFSYKFLPKGFRITEMVDIHEFGHQYFMAQLATNEFEEAWLDEGLTSYFETRIMDETYGIKKSLVDFFGIKIGDGELQRAGYVYGGMAKSAETYRKSWEYTEGGYSVMSYNKPATFLMTLDNLIGRENMDLILKRYYEQYKFKHPKTKDFIEIVNQVVSEKLSDKYTDMNWFFDQVLYKSVTCDYEVESVKNHKLAGFTGAFGEKNTKNFQSADYSKNNYKSQVVLRRNGEMIMPVEILILFDDGDKVLEHWDGATRTYKFEYNSPRKIISAKIDPNNKNLLETNLLNNSKVVEQEKTGILKYVLKYLFRLQNILQAISFLA